MQPSSDLAAGSSGSAVRLSGVTKTFANGVQALGPLDLAIAAGEFVSLLGPSGCGKSTVLRLLSGLDTPTSGTISRGLPGDAVPGYVFQDAALMPWASVRRNVELPLMLRGERAAAMRERVD